MDERQDADVSRRNGEAWSEGSTSFPSDGAPSVDQPQAQSGYIPQQSQSVPPVDPLAQQAYWPQGQWPVQPQVGYVPQPPYQSQAQYPQGQRYQPQARLQPQYAPQLQQQYMPQPQYVPQPQYAVQSPQPAPWYYPPQLEKLLRSARRVFSTVGFAMVAVLLVWQLVAVVAQISVFQFAKSTHLPGWVSIVVSNGPLYLVAIPLSLLIFRRLPSIRRTTSRLTPAQFFSLFSLAFPIAVAGNLVGTLLSSILSGGRAQNGLGELLNHLDLATMFLLTVVVAPFFEELLCRKLVIDRLLPYGEKLAIVVSAVMFGLFHGNLFQFFYAAGLGLILGYVYVRTGRMRYTYAMHMLFNFCGGFAPELLMSIVDKTMMKAVNSRDVTAIVNLMYYGQAWKLLPLVCLAVFNLTMVIVGIIVAIRNYKKLIFHRTPQEVPAGFRFRVAVGNVGMIVFIVLSAVMMLLSLFQA
jgi:uncharacterized protein